MCVLGGVEVLFLLLNALHLGPVSLYGIPNGIEDVCQSTKCNCSITICTDTAICEHQFFYTKDSITAVKENLLIYQLWHPIWLPVLAPFESISESSGIPWDKRTVYK